MNAGCATKLTQRRARNAQSFGEFARRPSGRPQNTRLPLAHVLGLLVSSLIRRSSAKTRNHVIDFRHQARRRRRQTGVQQQ